jgi:hypothetical protein
LMLRDDLAHGVVNDTLAAASPIVQHEDRYASLRL